MSRVLRGLRGRRGWGVVLGIAFGLGGLGGCGESADPRGPLAACPASALYDLGPWDSKAREVLRARLMASGRPHAAATWERVEARITAHRADWEQPRAWACAPSPAARECLATRAQIFAATLEALHEVDDETVEFAVDAAAALDPVSACARATGASSGGSSPVLDRRRRAVARARVLARTGQVWAGLAAVREEVDELTAAAAALEELGTATVAVETVEGAEGATPAEGPGVDPASTPAMTPATTPAFAPPIAGIARDLQGVASDARALLGGLLADTGDPKGALAELSAARGLAEALGDRQRLLALDLARAQVLGLRQQETAAGQRLLAAALAEARALQETAAEALILETQGLVHQVAGERPQAEAALGAAIAAHARPRTDGTTTPAVSAVMNQLGALRIADGRYDAAAELLGRTVARYRLDYGDAHPAVALALSNLALAEQRRGRYVAAREALEQAVALQEASLGADHPRLAASLDNLGLVARKLGAFERAREASERAIELYSQSLGPDHLLLVGSLRNLGNLARERGDLPQALAYLQRSQAIQEHSGDDPRAEAHALHDLANVYGRMGELDAAERHFTAALELLRGALGAGDPDLKGPLIGLGNVARDRGALDQAEARYNEALTVMRGHFDDDHPEVAVAFFNLGNIHKDRGRLDDAEVYYSRALAIREATLQPDHPLVIKNLTTLGQLAASRGDLERALVFLDRSLELSERRTGSGGGGDDPDPDPDREGEEGGEDGGAGAGDLPATEIAALRFLIARIRGELGGAAWEGAIPLAEAAAATYAAAGPELAGERAAVDRWLAGARAQR